MCSIHDISEFGLYFSRISELFQGEGQDWEEIFPELTLTTFRDAST